MFTVLSMRNVCFNATLAICCLAVAVQAQDELNLKTEKIIVFKDGYTMVIKTGMATTNKDGEIFTKEVPDSAVLGSFWATPKTGKMINMVAGWVEKEEEIKQDVDCAAPVEILKANLGKKCVVTLNDKTLQEGEILKVLAQETTQNVSTIQFDQLFSEQLRPNLLRSSLSSSATPSTITHSLNTISGSYFILRTNEGDLLLPVSNISRLSIKEMKSTISRSAVTKERSKRLTFRFAKPNLKQEMMIVYFRPGVRWIPTYRVNLTKNEKQEKVAELNLQAEIINEAEDLLDTEIDIVVGVPNFRFKDTPSPLILEQTLRNTLQQSTPALGNQFRNDFSNAVYGQQTADFRREAAQANADREVNLPNELTATGKQELFVYHLPKLKLKKGERTAVPIFQSTVPYRDIYTWDIHAKRHDNALAPSGSGAGSPLVLSQNKVWRQIELINNSNVPWTTGAAMIMEGRQPLAQELLTYTSPRDYCRVPVTVAINVRGSIDEQETNRELKSFQWRGYHYAKIFQQTKLDVCNNMAEDIKLYVNFRFGGKVDKVSDQGKTTLKAYQAEDWVRYNGDASVNNSSVVEWTTTLKAGETFLPTVDYHFFTRH